MFVINNTIIVTIKIMFVIINLMFVLYSHGGHSKVPRLFCDICEVFDQHDTDDCPLQATSDSPPPSLHHGIRGSERPYCETCECE